VPAIREPKPPRAMTGAEPLDFDTLPLTMTRARVPTPSTPPIAVSVHEKRAAVRKEKARRGLIIAASILVTLALAAAAYFVLA
jgi:hypothetical protein